MSKRVTLEDFFGWFASLVVIGAMGFALVMGVRILWEVGALWLLLGGLAAMSIAAYAAAWLGAEKSP